MYAVIVRIFLLNDCAQLYPLWSIQTQAHEHLVADGFDPYLRASGNEFDSRTQFGTSQTHAGVDGPDENYADEI